MKRAKLIGDLDRIVTEIPVSEVMIKDIKKLKENDSVSKAIDMMAKYSFSGMIITNDKNKPIGILSEGDIIKRVFSKKKNPEKIKIKEIMSKDLLTVTPDVNIGRITDIMRKKNISKLPVCVNEKIIGYVTKSDLIEKLNEIYYQNSRLKWYPLIVMTLIITNVILLIMLIKNNLS